MIDFRAGDYGSDTSDEDMMLTGKAVVVTGAGRGLGRAFAIDAARHGASVVVNDVHVDSAEETVSMIASFRGTAVGVGGSVCDWVQAEALIAQCVERFGKIDGLVNNAAIAYMCPPSEDTEKQVRDLIDVNVMGTIFCGHHAIRYMRERKSGAIVNLTSRAILGITGASTYAASKGAIASLTAAWSLELATWGIHVNCVAPHAQTPMEERRHLAIKDPALRPIGPDPATVAPLVTFLLSDRAASVSGQVVFMNGRELSLIRQPKMSAASLTREVWSAETVAESFDNQIGLDLDTIGIPNLDKSRLEHRT
jgi:NAD(P)-dependent dehydrogenase (short-subunit alcohol dehydrogenase family)